LDDKNKKQPKTPDERDPFRLEFIELNYKREDIPSSPQIFNKIDETPIGHSEFFPKADCDLPDFPVTTEMWEQFEKSISNPRRDDNSRFHESLKSGKHESGDEKPWNIIIERKSGRTYGFSQDEYVDWLKSRESRKIKVKCSNCQNDIEDNPFTGFHFCPYCGTKIYILGDDIRRIREVQESAIRESQQQTLSNPKFLTYPLDIPGKLLSSLTPPKFELVLSDYSGMKAPLIALALLLALLVIMFIESHLVVTRINLIIAAFIAVVVNIIALKRDLGVCRLTINQNGITFAGLKSSTTLRYERIVDIRATEEVSLSGSLKQRNSVLVLLLAPVTFFVYVMTSGLINIFTSLHDPNDPIKDEKDRIVSVRIKTRGSTVNFKINKSLHPDFSRFMGILIYMTKLESRDVKINEKAIFSAQRSSNASINAKKRRIDAIGTP
jgi:DNA-directed RNA polymerase subunit RPC12/RpoP